MSQNFTYITTSPTSSPAIDEPNIANNDETLRTNFSGASAPSPTFSGQHWFDTTTKIMYARNTENQTWASCSNPEPNKNISGNVTLDTTYDKMNCLVSGANVTITLPVQSTVVPNYSVNLILNDSAHAVTIVGNGAETFYRNGGLVNSVVIPNSNENSVLRLSNNTNGHFVVSGNLSSINFDFTGINDTGHKKMLDITFPVGTVRLFAVDATPPLQGVLGINWQLVDEGKVLMTANTSNVNQQTGVNRADTGSTNGHVLTVDQIPSHGHSVEMLSSTNQPAASQNRLSWVGDALPSVPIQPGLTGDTGSNASHDHGFSIKNYKVLAYRRIS